VPPTLLGDHVFQEPGPALAAVEENGLAVGPPVGQNQSGYSTTGAQIHPRSGAGLAVRLGVRRLGRDRTTGRRRMGGVGVSLGVGDSNIQGSVSEEAPLACLTEGFDQ
jgi:hypothetical protein